MVKNIERNLKANTITFLKTVNELKRGFRIKVIRSIVI